MRSIRTTLAVALTAVALAACGGSGGGNEGNGNAEAPVGASADAVTIAATEFKFDPASFSLPADTDVELVIENKGVVEHDITVDELGVKVYATGGKTVGETVNAAAGTYTFYCSIPGHREAGMEGTLTVE